MDLQLGGRRAIVTGASRGIGFAVARALAADTRDDAAVRARVAQVRQTGGIVGSIRNVAVAAMTKNLADELGRSGVTVTVVHPGMTVTERTPELVARHAAARGIDESAAPSTTSAARLQRRPLLVRLSADGSASAGR